MRRGLFLAALLPLAGCYVPPPQAGYPQGGYPQPGYGYAQPAYPQPAYPQPAYAPPPGYDQYGNIYPGYSDNDGSPTLFVDGAVLPLILLGDSWGYYDGRHEWHRAPDAVYRHLEQQRATGGFRGAPSGGGGYHPQAGGYEQPRQQARPIPAAAEPYHGGQPQPRPQEQARPIQPAYAAPRPAQAAPQRQEEHQRRECPPGQRC